MLVTHWMFIFKRSPAVRVPTKTCQAVPDLRFAVLYHAEQASDRDLFRVTSSCSTNAAFIFRRRLPAGDRINITSRLLPTIHNKITV